MYFADHNPPHFHAIYAEHEALIRIDNGSTIRGELPTTAMRLVEQRRALDHEELAANWMSAQVPAALSTIESPCGHGRARPSDRRRAPRRSQLRVMFSDGLVRELDFIGKLPGVLATVDDDVVFAGAAVDAVAGTVCWTNGIDLDPDVLHGDRAPASAVQPRVLRE